MNVVCVYSIYYMSVCPHVYVCMYKHTYTYYSLSFLYVYIPSVCMKCIVNSHYFPSIHLPQIISGINKFGGLTQQLILFVYYNICT